MEQKTLQERLMSLLTNFTYQSRSGLGRRGLMSHHIDALYNDLLPFINEEIRKQREDFKVFGNGGGPVI